MSSVLVSTTVVIGHPRAGSRTARVARAALEAILTGLVEQGLHPLEPDIIDLAELAPHVVAQQSGARSESGPVADALRLAGSGDLLIAASPTFKGSYTGLLKMFFELMPMDALRAAVAVPVTTAGWAQHRLTADFQLRTLLAEMGAVLPVRGLCLLEDELARLETVLPQWTAASVSTLAAVLRPRTRPTPQLSSTSALG